MPNWCQNAVVLTHKDPSMTSRARDGFKEGKLLQTFIPIPRDLEDTVSGSFGDDVEEAANQAKIVRNLSVYGYATWYDFCVDKWGTKWDVGGEGWQDIENGLQLNFESAWSPPVEAYRELEELGFHIEAMYYEPGVGFCGEYNTGSGENTITIQGNSDWVEENVPEDIDHAFNISVTMSEWEEEDNEIPQLEFKS